MKLVIRFLAMVAVAGSLAGCSTTQGTPDGRDPFEGFNRAMFNFNDNVDRAALKPAASAYREHTPGFVQIAVGNFFGNLADVWTAFNQFLQGNVADGLSDGMRFAVNSTLGFGGLLDIASEAGMRKHKQDFGATLGVWGVSSGPYVVLPLLGPSTVRDTAALPADFMGDLWSDTTPVHWRNTGSVVRVVDQRAALLNASNLLEDAALDRYEFVRDAYLQRRAGKIADSRATEALPPPMSENAASADGVVPAQVAVLAENDPKSSAGEPSAPPVLQSEVSSSTFLASTERPVSATTQAAAMLPTSLSSGQSATALTSDGSEL